MTAVARIAYTLAEAAEAVGQSVSYLRTAVKATDPQGSPPPLHAKRGAKQSLLVTEAELRRWVDSLPEA